MTESTILEKPDTSEKEPASIFDTKVKEMSDRNLFKQELIALPVVMFSDYVEVEVHAGLKKQISYQSFKELINKSLNQVEEAPVIKGVLPPSNTIFLSQSSDRLHINVYHPGGNKEMLYHTDKLVIAAPNIIIGFTFKKEAGDWVVRNANYFCTDLPVSKLPKEFINSVNHELGIYDLPMSNTYGGGSMCYGGNSMPARFKEGNLRGLDWYYRFLWETPFNDDLGVRAIGNAVNVRQWYNALKKRADEGKAFPYKDLVGYRALDGSPPTESALKRRD